jgi:hypothetical protein
MTKYSDIDETSEVMVKKFLDNYASDYTLSNVSDNRFLIKKIREIYSRKGSESAYEILFNILYKETISFLYPYDVVLKASSGTWTTPISLRVKQTGLRQNIFNFEHTEVVGDISKAKAVVNTVVKIDLGGNDIYELFLDKNSIQGNFIKEETISAVKSVVLTNNNLDTSNLKAKLYSVVSKINVVDGKLGYVQDQVVTITDSDNKGILAKAKVDTVNRFGSIVKVRVEETGINYSSNTYVTADAPAGNITGSYSVTNGVVTISFPNLHGITKGTPIVVLYTGNTSSPIYNTSHRTTVLSLPTPTSIRFKYPGF